MFGGKQHRQKRATIDHVLEIEKGGDNTPSNLVAACLQCNNHRSAKRRQTVPGKCVDCGAECKFKCKRCNICKLGFYAMPILLGLITSEELRSVTREQRQRSGIGHSPIDNPA